MIATSSLRTRRMAVLPSIAAAMLFCLLSTPAHAELVAHWTLDDPGGPASVGSIVDGVGGFNGTPSVGTTPPIVNFGQAAATGLAGTSADFINSKITVPKDPALNPDSFTFATWAYADALGTQSVVTSRYGPSNWQEGYILYNIGGNWSFWTGYNNGAGVGGWNQLSGGTATANAWTHLAISYDADTDIKSIYVNGTPTTATTPQYTPNTNGGGLHLGVGDDNGTNYAFNGKLDDAALWNSALSPADVGNAMANGAGTIAGSQVAHWALDEPATTGGTGSVADPVGGYNGTPMTPLDMGDAGALANSGTSGAFRNASVDVPHNAALNPTSFTVTAWARPNSTGGHQSLFTSRDDSPALPAAANTFGYILYNVNGNWEFWTGNGDPGWPNTVAAGAVQLNEWQHLAISYDAATNTKSLYVNGTLANSDTDILTSPLYVPNAVENLHIGGGADDGGSFRFNGNIDDVKVFDTALDAEAIDVAMHNNVKLSEGKTYSYSTLPRYSGGTYYYDEPHDQTVGVFDSGDLTDGEVFPNSTPTLPVDSTIVGWDPAGVAADIIFDLEELSTVETVIIGSHKWSAFLNGIPDDVVVSFSTTGIAPIDFGSSVAETFSNPPTDGHHDLTVDVPGTQARYVKLSFNGGTPAGNKWMLDEITIRGAVVPEPSTCVLTLLGLFGMLLFRRRR